MNSGDSRRAGNGGLGPTLSALVLGLMTYPLTVHIGVQQPVNRIGEAEELQVLTAVSRYAAEYYSPDKDVTVEVFSSSARELLLGRFQLAPVRIGASFALRRL